MNTEILDHAARVLRREPTRTLRARTLYRRTAAPLGIDIPYTRFLEMLGTSSDRFTIVTDQAPLGDGWPPHEWQRYVAALEQVGLMRGTTVILAEHPQAEQSALTDESSDTPIDSTLADVHAAIVELLRVEKEAGQLSSVLEDAVLELDELRDACASSRSQPGRGPPRKKPRGV